MPQKGQNLSLIAVLMPIILGMLGVSLYTGATSYIQDNLHNAAQNAALAGASAKFINRDSQARMDNILKPGEAVQSMLSTTENIWTRQVAASPVLQNIQASASIKPVNVNGSLGVQILSRGKMNTPFLAPLGIPEMEFQANTVSIHKRQGYETPRRLPLRVGNPPLPLCPGNNNGSGSSLSGRGENRPLVYTFPIPVTDRPGPDILITASSYRGFAVEACTGNECFDIGGGAHSSMKNKLDQFGMRHIYPDGKERITVFGSVVIDLGAAGVQYNGQIHKLTSIRLYDDGDPTFYSADGTMLMEVTCPRTMTIHQVLSLHHSMAGLLTPDGKTSTGAPPEQYVDAADEAISPNS